MGFLHPMRDRDKREQDKQDAQNKPDKHTGKPWIAECPRCGCKAVNGVCPNCGANEADTDFD